MSFLNLIYLQSVYADKQNPYIEVFYLKDDEFAFGGGNILRKGYRMLLTI